MATHSSTLAWKIPWTEEPGQLQSMGSQRVRHDRATSLHSLHILSQEMEMQPTPAFLPGESLRGENMVGFHLRGCRESDMTEAT